MRARLTVWLLLRSVLVSLAEQRQAENAEKFPKPQNPTPAYEISFKAEDGIVDLTAPVEIIETPQCSPDGTALLHFFQFPPAYPMFPFYSVSRSHEAHSFRLDQVPNFFDLRLRGAYLGEAEVVFLVNGAKEYKEGKEEAVLANGEKKEWKVNAAEHHKYGLIYDRSGHYKKMVQLDDTFQIQALGIFPGGAFLAFGYHDPSKSPRLALLRDNGAVLQYLPLQDNYLLPDLKQVQEEEKYSPRSSSLAVLGQVQLVSSGPNIIVAAVWSRLPLLEVTETGAVRSIPVRLPNDDILASAIASETALYVRPMSASESPLSGKAPELKQEKNDVLYEVNRWDGSALKRLEVVGKTHARVACVHDNDFVAFDWSTGKVMPLIGTAEPASHSPAEP